MNTQRGFALPLTLLLLILVTAGSAVLVTRMKTAHRERAVHAHALQARWAVEGALETAAHAIRQGRHPPERMDIAGHTVLVQARASNGHWTLSVRTHPNAAQVAAILNDTGRVMTWMGR